MVSRRSMAALLLLSVALLPVGACAPKEKAGVPYDLLFIDAMVAHHNGAIDMAGPAESNALHPELKEFARRVVEDQSREVALMTGWRQEWFPGRPQATGIMEMPGMAESMGGMGTDHLRMLEGADFDRAFIDMMVPHHQGAIVMATAALTRAEHPEVRALARQIIDAQQGEIEMMNRWKSEWSGSR